MAFPWEKPRRFFRGPERRFGGRSESRRVVREAASERGAEAGAAVTRSGVRESRGCLLDPPLAFPFSSHSEPCLRVTHSQRKSVTLGARPPLRPFQPQSQRLTKFPTREIFFPSLQKRKLKALWVIFLSLSFPLPLLCLFMIWSFVLFSVCFDTVSHVAQANPKPHVEGRMTLNS